MDSIESLDAGEVLEMLLLVGQGQQGGTGRTRPGQRDRLADCTRDDYSQQLNLVLDFVVPQPEGHAALHTHTTTIMSA
jgi:hypothetical protein